MFSIQEQFSWIFLCVYVYRWCVGETRPLGELCVCVNKVLFYYFDVVCVSLLPVAFACLLYWIYMHPFHFVQHVIYARGWTKIKHVAAPLSNLSNLCSSVYWILMVFEANAANASGNLQEKLLKINSSHSLLVLLNWISSWGKERQRSRPKWKSVCAFGE